MSFSFKKVLGFLNPDNSKSFEMYKGDVIEKEKTYLGLFIGTELEDYNKMAVEACITLLSECATILSVEKKDAESSLTKDNILLRKVHFLRLLGRFLGYYVNCDSWKEQCTKNYDSVELRKRLQQAMDLL